MIRNYLVLIVLMTIFLVGCSQSMTSDDCIKKYPIIAASDVAKLGDCMVKVHAAEVKAQAKLDPNSTSYCGVYGTDVTKKYDCLTGVATRTKDVSVCADISDQTWKDKCTAAAAATQPSGSKDT